MKSKRIKRKEGDVLVIALEAGSYCFGRVLPSPLIAFYDINTKAVPSIDDIISAPILFKLWVMDYAVKRGRWEVIGSRELDTTLTAPVKFFKEDTISKSLSIYYQNKEIPASREECEGLERAAAWDPEHVEELLRDHYLGVPNIWVESLKLNRE